jgi:hypothetical protein
MKSLTQRAFGRSARNCRLTRSRGHGAAALLTVVRILLPRTTPLRSISAASAGRPCSAQHRSLRAASGARPCAHSTRRSSPRRPGGSPGIVKERWICDSRSDGCGGDEAYARDRLEPAALLALPVPAQKFGFKRSDPRPQIEQVIHQGRASRKRRVGSRQRTTSSRKSPVSRAMTIRPSSAASLRPAPVSCQASTAGCSLLVMAAAQATLTVFA